ncbi:MAG TPA: hypothetical protein VNZ52_06285, partial [Candidatus Thermoplasmatota archaeon]|nr:hypothetical protein [Candidatus Thermoplasmatota archaeon]
ALATYEQEAPLPREENLALVAALQAGGMAVDLIPWTRSGVAWDAYDLVVVRTTWDYWDRLEEFLRWIEQVGPRLRNSPRLVRWNARKEYLFELEARGVRLPPTAHLRKGDRADLAALMRKRGWSEVVVKRLVGAGAAGQMRVRPGEEAAGQAHLDALLEVGDVLVQPFLKRVESHGEYSVVVFDGVVSHAVQKVPVKGDYRAHPVWGAATVPLSPVPPHLAEFALTTLRTLGERTLHARVDIVELDDGSPALMELEIMEPYLFLRECPGGLERFAEAIARHGAAAKRDP